MKRVLLFSLILSLGMIGYAQKSSLITKEQRQVQRTAVYTDAIYDLGNLEQPGNSTVGNFVESESWEVIGRTDYDFQSNACLSNRLTLFPDGTMAAVYTLGPVDTGPGFTDRGTGYNYYDGSNWGSIPTSAIETDRAGWPSHAPWGENGEIVVAHAWGGTVYTDGGLTMNTRPTKGTGEWTESLFLGPVGFEGAVWPRASTNGENNMNLHILHVLNQEYNGMADALLYSRSTDGGVNFDILHEQIDGIGPDDYTEFGADSYAWANPIGENIAFCFASTWHTDLAIMKSENSGEDWDKIIVWEHPYPFFDWDATLFDSLWAPDGGVDIAMDSDGNVHLAATITRVAHTDAGTTYNYWPYAEGVLYWNEDMDPFEADDQNMALDAWYFTGALEEDVNYIGWGQDMDGDGEFTLFNDELYTYRTIGANTMPTISCGDNGEVVVAWAGISEVDVYNELYNYRRIWTRWSWDDGETWTEHYNVNNDITMSFDDCIFPSLANKIDGSFYLLYQADYDIGTAVDGDHDYVENRMNFHQHDIVTGLQDKQVNNQNILVSQNYPNPATSSTKVNVELPATGVNLSIEICNLVGQVIYSEDKGIVKNSQNSFIFDVADFTSGVYFYTIKVNEETITQKMIVE